MTSGSCATAPAPIRKGPASAAELTSQAARAGDQAWQEALILDHLQLVKIIARQTSRALPEHVELDDLVQAGTLGLIDAARKFDVSKDVTFGIYAKHRIRGAILDSLRQDDPVSRDVRRKKRQIEAATAQLEQRLKREVTEVEVAAALNMDVERLRAIQLHLRGSEQISASKSLDEDMPDPQHPAPPEERPDSICARTELHNLVRNALAALPERHRRVLDSYFTGELTMKEIGCMMGVNESRVSQIRKAALKSMGRQLSDLGICSPAA